jgi:hypothetical protein
MIEDAVSILLAASSMCARHVLLPGGEILLQILAKDRGAFFE